MEMFVCLFCEHLPIFLHFKDVITRIWVNSTRTSFITSMICTFEKIFVSIMLISGLEKGVDIGSVFNWLIISCHLGIIKEKCPQVSLIIWTLVLLQQEESAVTFTTSISQQCPKLLEHLT